ncbi:MAG: DNA-3-methyladenine glycosylase I [Chloroflexota bacterium]
MADKEIRCFDGNPAMRAYHDWEWGRPSNDEQHLFEMLVLESFQSGIAWRVVLEKRNAFREAFAGFDPSAVASFTGDDTDRLMENAGIVRNRAKIEAAIANAHAVCALHERGSSLGRLAWPFTLVDQPAPRQARDIPVHTPEAEALAYELKSLGFRFLGPTTVYSFMQAVGIVNDHVEECFVRGEVEIEQHRFRVRAAVNNFPLH